MKDPAPKAYGEGRARLSVSYGEVERAAITLLKSERRPTVENIREAIGHGSPDTIGNALKRFWRDLGIRIEGDPAALTRMPPDIADLADGLWQKALMLAGDAAKIENNAAHERLEQIKIENQIRAQSFALREKEIDAAARAREKSIADSHEHVILLLKSLGREQTTTRAQQKRIEDLEAQLDKYRQQLAVLISRAAGGRPSRAKGTARHKLPDARRKTSKDRRAPVPRKRARPSGSAPRHKFHRARL
jgi:hypothetical protein